MHITVAFHCKFAGEKKSVLLRVDALLYAFLQTLSCLYAHILFLVLANAWNDVLSKYKPQ